MMGYPVLIIGESGSGKTYAIKNLDPDKVGIFLCEKNRPTEQFSRTMTSSDGKHSYELLVNPYPILPMHFTIPLTSHEP